VRSFVKRSTGEGGLLPRLLIVSTVIPLSLQITSVQAVSIQLPAVPNSMSPEQARVTQDREGTRARSRLGPSQTSCTVTHRAPQARPFHDISDRPGPEELETRPLQNLTCGPTAASPGGRGAAQPRVNDGSAATGGFSLRTLPCTSRKFPSCANS